MSFSDTEVVYLRKYYFITLFIIIVYRLEEKEQDMKQEYTKLHERYTELFKTHMDHIERTKILMGSSDRMDNTRSLRIPFMSMAHINRYNQILLKYHYNNSKKVMLLFCYLDLLGQFHLGLVPLKAHLHLSLLMDLMNIH